MSLDITKAIEDLKLSEKSESIAKNLKLFYENISRKD